MMKPVKCVKKHSIFCMGREKGTKKTSLFPCISLAVFVRFNNSETIFKRISNKQILYYNYSQTKELRRT